jgi:hypothetical protein
MCLNESRNFLSESLAMPGITTTANPNSKPPTKEESKTDNINEK